MREMAKVDWEQKHYGGTIEEQWMTFIAIFHSAQQKYIPVIRKDCRKRDNQPWISKEIKEGIKLEEKAYKMAKTSGNLEDWENVKGQQKAMEKAIKKSKMDYESKLAQDI